MNPTPAIPADTAPVILVPVDFSACAPLLVDEAIRFALAFRADILLLHATDLPGGLRLQTAIRAPDGALHPISDLLREDAAQHIDPLEAAVRAAGLRVRTEVRSGPPVASILAAAADSGARMIVMGTHGRTGWSRLAVGSVAESVLRQSPVPVVTVRTRHMPGCAAGSCDTCAADRSGIEQRLLDESEG